MSLFHHRSSPAAKCWLELEPPHDCTRLLRARKRSKKKKAEREKKFNSFCLSISTHLPVFCEVEIGNTLQMHWGDFLNQIKVPLPQWVKHSGTEKSSACSLSLNDCLISWSNLGSWLSRHFWCRRGGETGRDVITSLVRQMKNRGVINNWLVPYWSGGYLPAPLPPPLRVRERLYSLWETSGNILQLQAWWISNRHFKEGERKRNEMAKQEWRRRGRQQRWDGGVIGAEERRKSEDRGWSGWMAKGQIGLGFSTAERQGKRNEGGLRRAGKEKRRSGKRCQASWVGGLHKSKKRKKNKKTSLLIRGCQMGFSLTHFSAELIRNILQKDSLFLPDCFHFLTCVWIMFASSAPISGMHRFVKFPGNHIHTAARASYLIVSVWGVSL